MTPKAVFNLRLNLLVESMLTPAERVTVMNAGRERNDGLKVARKDEIAEAETHFENSRRMCENLSSEPARLIQESFQLAAEAYVLYKKEKYEDASAYLARAKRIDEMLIETNGCAILVGHIAQLSANEVRVQRRRRADDDLLRSEQEFVDLCTEVIDASSFRSAEVDQEIVAVVAEIVRESYSYLH